MENIKTDYERRIEKFRLNFSRCAVCDMAYFNGCINDGATSTIHVNTQCQSRAQDIPSRRRCLHLSGVDDQKDSGLWSPGGGGYFHI